MAIGFGTWPLGGQAYGDVPEEIAAAALKEAVALGVRLFDTANIYGAGRAESLLGAALTSVTDATVISKVGYLDERSGRQDFSDKHIRLSIDATRQRLKRDHVDVYLLHSPPSDVLGDPDVRASMERLVDDGFIKSVGVSLRSISDWRLALEWPALSVIEVVFSLLDQRAIDQGLLDAASRRGVRVLARVPLCFGLLTRRYAGGYAFPNGDHRSRWDQRQLDKWINGAERFAFLERPDRSLAQAALAFCLKHPLVCPIPGMKTPEQVRHNASAAGESAQLSAVEYTRIRQAWHELRDLPPA